MLSDKKTIHAHILSSQKRNGFVKGSIKEFAEGGWRAHLRKNSIQTKQFSFVEFVNSPQYRFMYRL